jgi:hypothetical protein
MNSSAPSPDPEIGPWPAPPRRRSHRTPRSERLPRYPHSKLISVSITTSNIAKMSQAR